MPDIVTCCPICAEVPGEVGRHFGDEPLGELERCDCCKQLVCPVCLHEADCCFWDLDACIAEDPAYTPPGWRRVSDTQFERVEVSA